MYDLSRMVFLAESSKGYTVRLTLPGVTSKGEPRGSVAINWIPFSATEHRNITQYKAEIAVQHLMNNILDIIEEVAGIKLDNQEVITVKEE